MYRFLHQTLMSYGGHARKLRQPSKLLEVVLPRPLGIVFEEDVARQQVVVGGFIPGSNAEQLVKVSVSVHTKAQLMSGIH